MTEAERIKNELIHAELIRDQLVEEIKQAKITITRGEYFLENIKWTISDMRVKHRRAKDAESKV